MKSREQGAASRVWLDALCAFLFAYAAGAGDLTTGYSFSSGEQNITHTKLNNAVNNAIINASFFTGQAAYTSPLAADTALVYSSSAGAFRKITLANLFLSQPLLITSQTEDTTPASGDFLLTYDVSDAGTKKATFLNAVFENAALISSRNESNTPSASAYFLTLDGSGWGKVPRSALFYNYANFSTFTNLAAHTAPTNQDQLLIRDVTTGTNKTTTLVGLITNLPVAPIGSLTSTDRISIVNTGVLKQVSMSAVLALVSNALPAQPITVKAWCKFDGTTTGTHAVTAGYGVSNVVRVSAGLYTLNLTNGVMATSNYCVTATVAKTDGETTWAVTLQDTNQLQLNTGRISFSSEDRPYVYVQLTE